MEHYYMQQSGYVSPFKVSHCISLEVHDCWEVEQTRLKRDDGSAWTGMANLLLINKLD
jgi:hypothetical protein